MTSWKTLGIGAACALTLGTLAFNATAAEYEWKLFTPFNSGDKPTLIYRDFAADLTKATGGRLKLDVFSAGELPYKNADVLRALATGQVEMADLAIGPVAGDVPELNVFVLPFVCTSMDQFYAAAPKALDIIDARFRDKFGVRGLGAWTMPPQQIWLKKPVGAIENLKGRKIRTWNRTQVEMLQLMGATGVAITPSEVIPALQRGVVDGAITAAIPAYDWKFYEVLSTGYMLNFTMTNQVIAVNNKSFEALPTDLQAVVADTSKAWQAKFHDAIVAAANIAHDNLQKKGMTLEQPSATDFEKARKLTRPMWDAWAKQNGDIAARLLDTVSKSCGG